VEPSALDEFEHLADPPDRGIMSAEGLDAQKRQLLGLPAIWDAFLSGATDDTDERRGIGKVASSHRFSSHFGAEVLWKRRPKQIRKELQPNRKHIANTGRYNITWQR